MAEVAGVLSRDRSLARLVMKVARREGKRTFNPQMAEHNKDITFTVFVGTVLSILD